MTEEAYMITNLNSVWQGEAISHGIAFNIKAKREITA